MNTLLTQNRTISFTYFFTIKDYSLIIPMMYMLIQGGITLHGISRFQMQNYN